MPDPNDHAEDQGAPIPAADLYLLPADSLQRLEPPKIIKFTHRKGKKLKHPDYQLRAKSIQNPALFWCRFAPRRDFEEDARIPEQFIKAFASGAFPEDDPTRVEPIRALQARIDSQQEAQRANGQSVDTLETTVQWRLVAGIGNSHPYENSLTLDRLFGFPYIAGSSWKGMLRSAVLERVAELALADAGGLEPDASERRDGLLTDLDAALTNGEAPKKLLDGLGGDGSEAFSLFKQAARVFGCIRSMGGIAFLDALPVGRPKLEADVMTPHTKHNQISEESLKESAGVLARGDATSPSPIVFLTVGRGTHFRFAWYGRDAELVQRVGDWLKDAVQDVGVGAKTTAGYGYLEPVSDGD